MTTINLPAMLEEDETQELYQQLLQVNINEDCVVEASAVERIKTPAVQLLISLQKTLAENDKALKIKAPSDYFLKFSGVLGAGALVSV